MTTGNAIVDKMQTFNATGNIIPPQWFKNVVRPNGKPNLNAIVILSDIVYWYKPRTLRDENTGHIVKTEKRFAADLLQRSYQQIADQIGISKREATNAVIELEKLGVIKRHLRNIKVNGMTMTNVLYLELIPARLFELTFEGPANDKQSDRSHFEKGEGPTLKRETNTEITTETTTKITNINKKEPSSHHEDPARIKAANKKSDTLIIPQKAAFGEFNNVLLTEEELKKLQEKFKDWATRIDNLSCYIESTGKKYKSHYATILSWARRDKKTKLESNPDYSYGVEGIDHL